MNEREVLEVLRISQKSELPCILCDKGTRNRGMFFPNDPVAAGVGEPPPGKARFVLYPSCEDHVFDEYTLTMVEEILRVRKITQWGKT